MEVLLVLLLHQHRASHLVCCPSRVCLLNSSSSSLAGQQLLALEALEQDWVQGVCWGPGVSVRH